MGRASVLLAAVILLAIGLVSRGYVAGSATVFYGGLLLLAAATGPLAFALGRGRWRDGVPIAGISIAIFIVLCIAGEIAWRGIEAAAARRHDEPVAHRIYGFEEARADRKGFEVFWSRHLDQMRKVPYVMADPRALNPYVLRPSSRSFVFGSEVRINSLGFRGPETSIEKGERFRIVALGESTTFGALTALDQRPWPEALEDRIRSELVCDAPIEVINAGVPGWTLINQLKRMQLDILPLHPDLIVSYHGYNGFRFFLQGIPGLPFHPVPDVPPRPSRLLERAEKTWRLWNVRRSYAREFDPAALQTDPLHTAYADRYRDLIRVVRSNGIELVLATFNLAVNAQSPQEVVDFYAEGFPEVRSSIVANQLHSRLLHGLPRPSGVHVIDTTTGIDGEYRDLFLDLFHFTQAGRERLAASVYSGIRPILLAHPRLRCRPARRDGAERNGE